MFRCKNRIFMDKVTFGTIALQILLLAGCKTTKVEQRVTVDTTHHSRTFNYSGNFDLFETIDICAIDTDTTGQQRMLPRYKLTRKVVAHQRDTVNETDTTTAIKSTTRVRTTVPRTFMQGDNYARWWLILKLVVILFVILVLIRKVK